MINLEIIGRIGRDAEVKKIGEHNYLAFSVCHSEKRGDKEYSVWVDCLKYAKDDSPKLQQYLTKGSQVYVNGTPRANAWIGNDNKPQASITLNVNQLELLGSRQADSGNSTPQQSAPQQGGDDDNMPF